MPMDLGLIEQVNEFYELTIREAINNNQDIKKLLISKLYRIDYDHVTDEQRSKLKIENIFGELNMI